MLIVNVKTYVMRFAIWYHLYNSKNVKNTHGGVLLLVKLQLEPATLLKVTLNACVNTLPYTKSY